LVLLKLELANGSTAALCAIAYALCACGSKRHQR